MKQNNNYLRIFLEAFRTAVIFVSGFLIYEILLQAEKEWNKLEPSHKMYHFYKRKSIKFLLIFTIDLTILFIFNYLGVFK
jgi:preprotein translocase subunit SecG